MPGRIATRVPRGAAPFLRAERAGGATFQSRIPPSANDGGGIVATKDYSSAMAARDSVAASIVRSMSASVCAPEMKAASN